MQPDEVKWAARHLIASTHQHQGPCQNLGSRASRASPPFDRNPQGLLCPPPPPPPSSYCAALPEASTKTFWAPQEPCARDKMWTSRNPTPAGVCGALHEEIESILGINFLADLRTVVLWRDLLADHLADCLEPYLPTRLPTRQRTQQLIRPRTPLAWCGAHGAGKYGRIGRNQAQSMHTPPLPAPPSQRARRRN